MLTGELPPPGIRTPFTRFGDWVGVACAIGLAAAGVVALTARRASD